MANQLEKRISGGFCRLGIGVAVMVAIGGSGVTTTVAISQYRDQWYLDSSLVYDPTVDELLKPADGRMVPVTDADWNAAFAVRNLPPGFVLDVRDPSKFPAEWTIVRHRSDYYQFINSRAFAAGQTFAIGLGITAAISLAVFGFFRGMGWVISGFAQD